MTTQAEETAKFNRLLALTKVHNMVVIVKDVRIPYNKQFFCHYSEMFKACMTSSFKEGQTGEFTITDPDATVDGVRQFLRCFLNPWDRQMGVHIHEIYRLAHMYQTPLALDRATRAFGRNLRIHNFWSTVTTCNGNACPELIAECETFLKKTRQFKVARLFVSTNEEFSAARTLMPTVVDNFIKLIDFDADEFVKQEEIDMKRFKEDHEQEQASYAALVREIAAQTPQQRASGFENLFHK